MRLDNTIQASLRIGLAMMKLWGTVLATAALSIAAAAKADEPPKELVTYIHDAKKLGLDEQQIRRNATAAGWEPKIIDEAFAASTRPLAPVLRSANSDLPDNYRIGIGDVLQVSVWREPEASVPSAAVRSDGKISMPLIKEVEVAGMTPPEAERMLSERLSRYIHGADVAVIVKEVHSRRVYLVGGVRAVGAVELKGPMTVLQALTQSGGVTDYAKRKQIYVLRVENGKQTKLPFNYEAVIKGENVEQNIVLLPNDTVVVPQ
jgi:polysaccharide biosynthesis/export protein